VGLHHIVSCLRERTEPRTTGEGDAKVVPGWRGPAIGEVERKRNYAKNPVGEN